MTAKQHIAEAEKDAKECAEHLRAALMKTNYSPSIQNMALNWMLQDLLKSQLETLAKIKRLLA
jgi:hypothetical protein